MYDSGSVVIQGAKCTVFSDAFFHKLKQECDNTNSEKGNHISTEDVTKWQLKLLTISRLIIASLCVYLRVQKILCVTRHLITKPQITPRLSKPRSVDDIHCMSAVQSRGNCDFFKTPKTQMTPK